MGYNSFPNIIKGQFPKDPAAEAIATAPYITPQDDLLQMIEQARMGPMYLPLQPADDTQPTEPVIAPTPAPPATQIIPGTTESTLGGIPGWAIALGAVAALATIIMALHNRSNT